LVVCSPRRSSPSPHSCWSPSRYVPVCVPADRPKGRLDGPRATTVAFPATIDSADRADLKQAAAEELGGALAEIEIGKGWDPGRVNERLDFANDTLLLRWSVADNTVTLHLATSRLSGGVTTLDGGVIAPKVAICASITIDAMGSPAAHASEPEPEDCTFPFRMGVPDYAA
jgi:hypothetical protein